MNLRDMLLSAPKGQIDQPLLDLIAQWSDPPTALQVLRVLDLGAYTAGTSDFTMKVMDIAYQQAVEREGTSRETVESLAEWRDGL